MSIGIIKESKGSEELDFLVDSRDVLVSRKSLFCREVGEPVNNFVATTAISKKQLPCH